MVHVTHLEREVSVSILVHLEEDDQVLLGGPGVDVQRLPDAAPLDDGILWRDGRNRTRASGPDNDCKRTERDTKQHKTHPCLWTDFQSSGTPYQLRFQRTNRHDAFSETCRQRPLTFPTTNALFGNDPLLAVAQSIFETRSWGGVGGGVSCATHGTHKRCTHQTDLRTRPKINADTRQVHIPGGFSAFMGPRANTYVARCVLGCIVWMCIIK